MNPKQSPKTETKTVSEARKTFSEILNRVYRGETRVLVEKNGIPVGGIVSAGDLERLQRLESRRAEQWEAVERMREALADVPEEELDSEIERALDEVKEDYERQRSNSQDSAA